MRVSISTTAAWLLLLPLAVQGFLPPHHQRFHKTSSLAAETADEAARRLAASAATKPGSAAQQPTLFNDELLMDMQQCLLKLEKRVKHGPGSLSMLEVEEFSFASQRIVREMKLNEHNRPKPAPLFPTMEFEDGAAAAPTTEMAFPTEPTTTTTEPNLSYSNQEYTSGRDISLDEGPEFDGTGIGISKGTTNTYVIPGMDEMSPEEYQVALQATISARQARRVASGQTGNRNSNDYLKNLGAAAKAKKRWDPSQDVE